MASVSSTCCTLVGFAPTRLLGSGACRCSAVVLKAGKDGQYEAEGYGQRPYDNWSRIMFDCTGQEFKTVMSALKSNNERCGLHA